MDIGKLVSKENLIKVGQVAVPLIVGTTMAALAHKTGISEKIAEYLMDDPSSLEISTRVHSYMLTFTTGACSFLLTHLPFYYHIRKQRVGNYVVDQ